MWERRGAFHSSRFPTRVAWIDTPSVLIRENFREYLDHLLRDGYSVRHDEHLSDPDLIDPGGNPVETWREDYPYDERLDRDVYEGEVSAADRAAEVPVLAQDTAQN